ncbi:MAG: dihydrodipicolinate synthase family protein, partial [SAR324 cluster bacterium]|nr:dihydrodipicolinate synthase family protein [SAR324 cluster bacterium]
MNNTHFGCIPALMTPCSESGTPDFNALVRKGKELIGQGMSSVVYCGSMGDWPLLSEEQRQRGVAALVDAGVPVIVGTGAQNTQNAVSHAAHAKSCGARGLMIIPRVLSRGTSPLAQKSHLSSVLEAGVDLPSVIYNSPYYGFETKAELFFELRKDHPNLVGFKEFGGAQALSYAAEHITSGDEQLALLVGVDTQVCHGMLRCGAIGLITGIGNVLPQPVLKLFELCQMALKGDAQAKSYANQLDDALMVLSTFDEGPDLVLYYKYLLFLKGESEYEFHFNAFD